MSRKLLSFLILGAALAGCAADVGSFAKGEGDADADLFDGAADSAARPTPMGRLGDGASAEGSFGRNARYLSWLFDATEGDVIHAAAEGVRPRNLDTVLAIYRVNAANNPVGAPIAINDDCGSALSSCIDDLTAPATGTYIMVVRRYDRGATGTVRVSLDLERAEQACGSRGLPECPEGMFCAFAPEAMCGAADHPGVCARRPDACIAIYDPVCGCDGRTYGSACSAANQGVSVAYDGECASSCDAQDARGEGFCRRLPFGFAWNGSSCTVVQGCECIGEDCDSLYATQEECFAAHTECEATCGGLLGLSCPEGQFCSFAADAMCGAGDQTGTCADRPEACTALYRPVCGCDGRTYGNACSAANHGISVAHDGECAQQACGGLLGLTCPAGQFCNYAPEAMCGAADQTGTCTAIPEICTRIGHIVCGCDGNTYSNDCEANRAGTSVASEGECRSSGDCRSAGCGGGQYCSYCWGSYQCIPDGAVC